MSLDALFNEDARTMKKPGVSGKWFEIRLTPDLVTGELLNIGVGFIQNRTKAFHFRLLETAAPFACLYGPRAREQFGFLLATLRESMTMHGASSMISPQISFGTPRPASGESVAAVLDSLYASVVTLGRFMQRQEDLAETEPNKAKRSTETVRLRVRKAFSSIDKKGFSEYWHDDPVPLKVDDVVHPLDLQLWKGKDLVSPNYFASIISACYKDAHYRRSFLTGAYQALTIARSFGGDKARGSLFILRPEANDGVFGGELQTTIDNEIDHTTWALLKKYQVRSVVETAMERLKEQVLAFT